MGWAIRKNPKAEAVLTGDTLAPYVLTCLIQPPKRLIYLSSGMHLQGRPNLDKFAKDINRITYSDYESNF